VLGWCSHMGMRFLREVVVDFAQKMGVELDTAPDAAIAEATDPLAILAECNEHLREFRQGVFHKVAQSELELNGYDAQTLDEALKETLIEWIDRSFDEDADIRWPKAPAEGEEPKTVATERAVTFLPEEEQRDLLGWALRLLPLPTDPDWEDREHVAALRAAVLALRLESSAGAYGRASEVAGGIVALETLPPLSALGAWTQDRVPRDLFYVDELDDAIAWWQWQLEWIDEAIDEDWRAYWRYDVQHRLSDALKTRGDWQEAAELSSAALDYLRAQQPEPDDRRWHLQQLAARIADLGDLESMAGNLDRAEALQREALGIREGIDTELRDDESRRDVSVSLCRVASIEQARGDLDAALAKHEEALAIRRALADELETPQSRCDVALSLDNVGDIEEARGDLDAAWAKYEEALAIRRTLADEMETAASRRDVTVSLDNVARIEETRGEQDAALAKYEESLDIGRELACTLATPESRRDVSVSLDYVARFEQTRGELDAALAKYVESLAIRRALADELETPLSRRDVSISLNNVADIEQARGGLHSALAKYEEALAIRRALADELETPQSQSDLSVSLGKVASIEQSRGNLDAALAKFEESLAIDHDLFESSDFSDSIEGAAHACNGVCWSTCQLTSCLLAMGNPSRAQTQLTAVEHLIPALEHPDLCDANLLDTAATFHERRAECATQLGDQALAAASAAKAAALRARIADINSN
jgi:tetratricopeptide (TPR) repeat protein